MKSETIIPIITFIVRWFLIGCGSSPYPIESSLTMLHADDGQFNPSPPTSSTPL